MKREIELYPWLILPVIREIFHREYGNAENVRLLSTEYTLSRVHEGGEKLLHAIRSDILLKIRSDLYHFECQIEKDGKMVFRMMEYDVHIALVHGRKAEKDKNESGEFEVAFPKSAVLYLGDEENIPEYEACILRFQDGSSHLYRVPVMKVQGYSLERIEEKHLNILIPFLPIRFRKKIKRMKKKKKDSTLGRGATEEELVTVREGVKKDITSFILECISVLGSEKEKGILSENVRRDIGELLWKACGYLLEEDAELYREVSAEVEPAIKLSREIIQELQGNNKKLHQELENACKNLIDREICKGTDIKEIKKELMEIFTLTEKEAEEKIKTFQMALKEDSSAQ